MTVYVAKTEGSNWRSTMAALVSGGNNTEELSIPGLSKLREGDTLVISGVGHMQNLSSCVESEFGIAKLRRLIRDQGVSILGICLGFQFLCESSEEGINSECLGIIPLNVTRLPTTSVGWFMVSGMDAVERGIGMDAFANRAKSVIDLLAGNFFYFTHAFGAVNELEWSANYLVHAE